MPEVLYYTGEKIPGGVGRLPAGWERINSVVNLANDHRRGLVYYRLTITAADFYSVWASVTPDKGDHTAGWVWSTRGQREKFGHRTILGNGGPFPTAREAMTAAAEHAARIPQET